MKKLCNVCTDNVKNYIVFVFLLTITANWIGSFSLPGLDVTQQATNQTDVRGTDKVNRKTPIQMGKASFKVDSILLSVKHNSVQREISQTRRKTNESTTSLSIKEGIIVKNRPDIRDNGDTRSKVDNTPVENSKNNARDNYKRSCHITVFPFKGGLGNQMFQLASLVGFSRKNNCTMVLHRDHFQPDSVFDMPSFISRPTDINLNVYHNYAETSHAKYSNIQLNMPQNWTLEGYFQSYKYFSGFEKDVRQVFKLKEDFVTMAERFLRDKVLPDSVKVGIHVRRGDFVSAYEQKLGRIAPGIGYITKAMTIFQRWYKNITFIVFSDDKKWCLNNIKAENVVHSPFQHEGTDLALASKCDHMIITVGTFSWWAGWLSAGRVIYYADYPRAGSKIDSGFSKEDYYPMDWISVSG